MKVRFIRSVDGYTMDRDYIVPDSHGRHYIAGKMAVSAENIQVEDVPAVINRPSVLVEPVAPIIRRTDKAAPQNVDTEDDAEGADDESGSESAIPDNIPERGPEHVKIVEAADGLKSPKRTQETPKVKPAKPAPAKKGPTRGKKP